MEVARRRASERVEMVVWFEGLIFSDILGGGAYWRCPPCDWIWFRWIMKWFGTRVGIATANYLLTYSMVQSPSWEANWFAASQEIPPISRNPKVHYRTHKRLPPLSILGQPNPVHIPTSHLLEMHPTIIHPSTPRSPQLSPSLRFPQQDPIHPPLLTHTCHMSSMLQRIVVEIGRCVYLGNVECYEANSKANHRSNKNRREMLPLWGEGEGRGADCDVARLGYIQRRIT